MATDSFDLCVVGGGPAGMMAGYLFARAGVRTLVVEKHGDFLRDFRGDTVHPSTLDLFGELGLLDRLLERPHDRVSTVGGVIGGKRYTIGDFRHLPKPGRFIAMMPQWEFLDFLCGEARKLAAFTMWMEAEAAGPLFDGERVIGIALADGRRARARLVIAADGRRSVLREKAALPLEDLGAPIDVLWFRVPKPRPTAQNHSGGYVRSGEMLVQIDRGDYFQCARVIAKGSAEAMKARGLDRFRDEVADLAPMLRDCIGTLTSWDEVKLLSVSLDRLTRWSRPGLLAIGDAAHAMSPVGGVGINLAIQDAVAAANLLAAPLAKGTDVDPLLPRVERRRLPAVKAIQGLQRAIHHVVINAALGGAEIKPPLVLKLLNALPPLQRIPARVLGLGFRREHIRSPEA